MESGVSSYQAINQKGRG